MISLPGQTKNADGNRFAYLDAAIQRDIDDGNCFGGTIIVGRGGEIVHRRTYGAVAPGRPTADDDIYLAMSTTKSFTAVLVLGAIDQGRFTLDTKIAELIPEFAFGGKQRVTVRHLLNHTGGAWGGLVPPPPLPITATGDLEQFVQGTCMLPAAFTPGTRCVYSPLSGFAVLGQLLVLTDPLRRSFRDIAREDLFEPLGMHDTQFGCPKDEPRRVMVSFTEKMTRPNSIISASLFNEFMAGDAEVPAGNAFTTIDDLFRFAEAVRRRGSAPSTRLVSPSLFGYAAQNATGDMSSEVWDFYREAFNLPDFPANFTLLGGYVRDKGHYLNAAGYTASPSALTAVGAGSTMWMVDPERDLTVAFLSAGLIEGLAHLQRVAKINDLVLSAC
jgi:CubicO group peptidase (beta-lactamase class C family)